MLYFFGNDPKGSARLDAIRIAGTIVVGTGGAVALLLTARRQRFTELDGTERRITELQTKAADQLGHEKAAVRLAGLHSLERLAQDHPNHRQTIVNIICAYLRMPFTPPTGHSRRRPTRDSLRGKRDPLWMRPNLENAGPNSEESLQEQVVRKTAQTILTSHLRKRTTTGPRFPGLKEKDLPFWEDIALNLEGATLVDFNFSSCECEYAYFDRAKFTGSETSFLEAKFMYASFIRASFERSVSTVHFSQCRFTIGQEFTGTEFHTFADFGGAFLRITSWPAFDFAKLRRGASFSGATIELSTQFSLYGEFYGATTFSGAKFSEGVDADDADLIRQTFFEDIPDFSGTPFRDAQFKKLPSGWYVMET